MDFRFVPAAEMNTLFEWPMEWTLFLQVRSFKTSSFR